MYTARELAFEFVASFNNIILFPLIALISGVALLLFLYGGFIFIVKADNESERATGKQHMLWGIVGLVVMFSAWALLEIAANTFGRSDDLDCINEPTEACPDYEFQTDTP